MPSKVFAADLRAAWGVSGPAAGWAGLPDALKKMVSPVMQAHVGGRLRQRAPELCGGSAPISSCLQQVHSKLKLVVIEVILELARGRLSHSRDSAKLSTRPCQVPTRDVPTALKVAPVHGSPSAQLLSILTGIARKDNVPPSI